MAEELTREQVDRLEGLAVLEFGATWCGHCQAFKPELKRLLRQFSDVQHIWVEDGKGKPLGRSFRVTLWPTLIFLRDGEVVEKMARPSYDEALEGFLAVSQPQQS